MKKLIRIPFCLILISVLVTSCGPSPEQQATLIAVSIFSTLTAQAISRATDTALPPTETQTPPPPTSTPTSTSTPTPNKTATEISNIYETATAQAKWKPTLYDSFGENIFEWCDHSYVVNGDDGSKSQIYFDNGVYHMIYTAGEKYPQTYCAPYGTYYDFQVSILAKLLGGDRETSYGLVFRAYKQNFKGLSRFIINPSNEYRIDTRDSQGNWIVLQDWTKTNDMKPQGEWNKITVSGIGPEFTFYINDKFQSRVKNPGADAGKGAIGLVLNSDVPRKSIEVLFDDLTIREP